jgi:dynein heavy chain
MNPSGDDFRRRIKTYPSLVNCTTIDWFLPWPEEAYEQVARTLLAQNELINKVSD